MAKRPQLLTTRDPVTSWLIWSQPGAGTATGVLRASFRNARLIRREYESFGDESRRLVKGAAVAVEVEEDELRRMWRRTWQATQAAEECQDALFCLMVVNARRPIRIVSGTRRQSSRRQQ